MQLNIILNKKYVLAIYKYKDFVQPYLLPKYILTDSDYEMLENIQGGFEYKQEHINYISERFGIFGKWEKYKNDFSTSYINTKIKDIITIYMVEKY